MCAWSCYLVPSVGRVYPVFLSLLNILYNTVYTPDIYSNMFITTADSIFSNEVSFFSPSLPVAILLCTVLRRVMNTILPQN